LLLLWLKEFGLVFWINLGTRNQIHYYTVI
jgi:hypothetical protein